MTIKGVICDFGGVLVLNGDQSARQKWATRLGMDTAELIHKIFYSDAANQASIGRITEDELWELYGKQFELSQPDSNKFREDFFSGDKLNVDLINFISELPAIFKKAILSNAWLGARRLFTENFHFDDIFDLIVISAEEGIAKPDDEIFYRTAQRLGLNTWELLFIDDMVVNAQAAAKVSMAAIHFQDTESTIRQITTLLNSQGVAVV
ncbi:MAG: HAD family phosphatase [Anaerolineaceae bacterium]